MTRSLISLVAAVVVVATLAPRAAGAQDLRLAPVPFPQDTAELKRTLRNWDLGDPIPYGYHPERKPRVGLLVAGSLTFAVPYVLSAYVGASSNKAEMYVPVVGPFVAAVETMNTPCTSWLCFREVSAGMTVAIGVVEAVGAAMLIAGAVGKVTLVEDEPGSVSVAPMYLPNGAGLGVSGQF